MDADEVEPCLAKFVSEFGVKAKLVVPIIQEIREIDLPDACISPATPRSHPHLWGLLIAHQCRSPRQWQPLEIDLMKQLATQVAIAIQQSELYQQLQQLNGELEIRVKQRTEELAKTNEALRHTNQTLQSLIYASPAPFLPWTARDW